MMNTVPLCFIPTKPYYQISYLYSLYIQTPASAEKSDKAPIRQVPRIHTFLRAKAFEDFKEATPGFFDNRTQNRKPLRGEIR